MNAVSAKINDLEVEAPERGRYLYLRQADVLSPTAAPKEICVHATQVLWLIRQLSVAIAPVKPHISNSPRRRRRSAC